MFRNRHDAAVRLARALRGRSLHDPIVLGIPRGGVVLAAVLARELNAELDVVLARKLRAPGMPELAIGAVGEDGCLYLEPGIDNWVDDLDAYLGDEIHSQQAELARRKAIFRGSRPRPHVEGRSVIVTDDGIATGSTMIAALKVLDQQHPREVIVAVPVASADRLKGIGALCDDVVSLLTPTEFRAIGQFYEDFTQVDDQEAAALLQSRWRTAAADPA
ncbi:MAG: phosphoribosyltransferase family protein [Gemmataceae bacterium]